VLTLPHPLFSVIAAAAFSQSPPRQTYDEFQQPDNRDHKIQNKISQSAVPRSCCQFIYIFSTHLYHTKRKGWKSSLSLPFF